MAYMNQQRKAILVEKAKSVAKKYGAKITYRVRNHSTIIATVKATSNIEIPSDLAQILADSSYPIDITFCKGEGKFYDFKNELKAALMTGNHDNSDIITDYFDVGWYVYIQVDN